MLQGRVWVMGCYRVLHAGVGTPKTLAPPPPHPGFEHPPQLSSRVLAPLNWQAPKP